MASKTPPDQRPEGEAAEPYSTARVAERFDAAPVASPSSSAATKRRKPRRARDLGVSDEDYAAMLAAQDGHCALCPSTPKTRRLHVDHDHATGTVRGLLCHRCNRGLPTWANSEWLLSAAAYVHPNNQPAA